MPNISEMTGTVFDGVANPLIGEARGIIDAEPQFRQFFCAGCGVVENEVALATRRRSTMSRSKSRAAQRQTAGSRR